METRMEEKTLVRRKMRAGRTRRKRMNIRKTHLKRKVQQKEKRSAAYVIPEDQHMDVRTVA